MAKGFEPWAPSRLTYLYFAMNLGCKRLGLHVVVIKGYATTTPSENGDTRLFTIGWIFGSKYARYVENDLVLKIKK